MKTVCTINMCSGCMACVDVCSQNAVQIIDQLRFYNAVIDTDKCINCNACHKVCQVNKHPDFIEPSYIKQGWSKDNRIRNMSSSGGIAAALEIAFVNKGGIVYSCCFENGSFVFRSATRVDEVEKFKGSKYVKSNPMGVYKRIKADLNNKKDVMFVGLPCQVAAVLNYCRNKEHLTVVDLICHGTPSPKVLESYLRSKSKSIDDIADIRFRIKDNFGLYVNNQKLSMPEIQDYYTKTFLEAVSYTDGCYACSYARTERVSDITLGDSWGSELSTVEQRKGISLILCQTEKGKRLIESLDCELYDVDFNKAIDANPQLKHPAEPHVVRDKFLNEIVKGKGFNMVVLKCFPKRFIKDLIKKQLIKYGIFKKRD